MPLQQGEVQGTTSIGWSWSSRCSIKTRQFRVRLPQRAIDDLEGGRGVKPDQRADQFIRLCEAIEERVSRKFFPEQVQADRPVVLRSVDCS